MHLGVLYVRRFINQLCIRYSLGQGLDKGGIIVRLSVVYGREQQVGVGVVWRYFKLSPLYHLTPRPLHRHVGSATLALHYYTSCQNGRSRNLYFSRVWPLGVGVGVEVTSAMPVLPHQIFYSDTPGVQLRHARGSSQACPGFYSGIPYVTTQGAWS